MDYEFDRMPKPQGASPLFRRILIFVIVLAVTGGIIYGIVPHKKTGSGASPKAVGESPQPVAENTLAETSQQSQTAKSDEKPADALPEETTEEKSVETSAEVPTQTPVKGVAWQGDPAVDVPEKPISAETAAAEQRRSADNWKQVEEGTGVWCIRHQISRGDNLEKLAKKYHTTVALIKELNHLKGNTIFLGSKLVVVPGPWQIEISKSSRRLQLFNLAKEKTLFAAYDVGVGRADSTPAEKFVISIRLYHPEYYAPNGAIYAYGDPENPMGDYFLKLAKAEQLSRPLAGYGIHGSPDDAGVGRSISHGCVRMRNQEVRQLYLLCPVGTSVSITE